MKIETPNSTPLGWLCPSANLVRFTPKWFKTLSNANKCIITFRSAKCDNCKCTKQNVNCKDYCGCERKCADQEWLIFNGFEVLLCVMHFFDLHFFGKSLIKVGSRCEQNNDYNDFANRLLQRHESLL